MKASDSEHSDLKPSKGICDNSNSNLIEQMCHDIRTPLSVIINDLNYLKTINPNDEMDRMIRNANRIKEILLSYSKANKE